MSQPPPGWYRHHADPRYERWWDGQQWTDHTRMPPDEVSRPIHVGRSVPKDNRNDFASTGFGLGIAAILLWGLPVVGLLLSLAVLLLSGIGLSRMKPTTATKYRLYGRIGLALGIISTFLAILYITGLHPSLN